MGKYDTLVEPDTDACIIKNFRTVGNTPSSGSSRSPHGLGAEGRLRGLLCTQHSCAGRACRVEEECGEKQYLGSILQNDGKLLSEVQKNTLTPA